MEDWEVYDRRFRALLLPTVKLEKLFTGALWAEGPVWFSDTQCLLFSDIPNDRMLRWVEGAPVTIFRAPSRYANGNTRDAQGRLVTCEHGSRSVTRTEPDGSVTTIADHHAGGRLNSPNDVVVGRDGAVWFTDPPYGILSDYEGHKAPSEQKGSYVFRVDPSSGAVTVAADDLGKPNGLAFSPDQETLYIADSDVAPDGTAPRHVRRFRVTAAGLRGGEEFAKVEPGVPDGLRTDTEGNVWISCGSGVLVFSSGGDRLGKIVIPDAVSNLTFGGPRRNRLFITAQGSLYALYVNARGAQEP
ncbi:MAG TPA: SMP-30/gluconolactonase/LRE family protein [Spirochaetia bacterium]|nr:SMP-30/gluconolactonase/LRE family protein [Spirochaetia bacterium]